MPRGKWIISISEPATTVQDVPHQLPDQSRKKGSTSGTHNHWGLIIRILRAKPHCASPQEADHFQIIVDETIGVTGLCRQLLGLEQGLVDLEIEAHSGPTMDCQLLNANH